MSKGKGKGKGKAGGDGGAGMSAIQRSMLRVSSSIDNVLKRECPPPASPIEQWSFLDSSPIKASTPPPAPEAVTCLLYPDHVLDRLAH